MSVSIHDAYGGFGDKTPLPPKSSQPQSQIQLQAKESKSEPIDVSYSAYPTKVRCEKCHNVSISNMRSEMGTAAWVWCVLLAPFACIGFTCLCLESCRDKIHYCNRCGHIVGKKYAKVC